MHTAISQAQNLFKKHGINIDLKKSAQPVSIIGSCVYSMIENEEPDLEEGDKIALFNAMWHMRNIERGVNLDISDSLERKIISGLSGQLDLFGKFVFGQIDGEETKAILEMCSLDKIEEAELWHIFHVLSPEFSSRDSDQTNNRLGIYKLVERKLKLSEKIRVLDLGCGPHGISISTLAERYSGKVEGYGLDLEIKGYSPNVNLSAADMQELKFPNSFFDVIYSDAVMGYLKAESRINAFNEALRVLKRGGYLVYSDVGIDKSRLNYRVKLLATMAKNGRFMIKY